MMAKRRISLLSLLLAALLSVGSFVALPAAAVSLDEAVEEQEDILWELEQQNSRLM